MSKRLTPYEKVDNFKGCIIKTYKTWYRELSNGEKVSFQVEKNWEYQITAELKHNDKLFIWIIYNLDNGYCNPKKEEDRVIQELENLLAAERTAPKQLSIFDFM